MTKKKIFTLRVDLESDRGIKEGVPKLLDLLKNYNIRASFYLVMGGESNIFDILKYQGKMKSSAERSIKVWTFFDKIRMVLFPVNFATKNKEVLQRIIDEGHELGLHGWKHREWTRGLDKIDIEKTIKKAISRYEKIFGEKPVSWASPGFNINENALKALEVYEISYISDFEGNKAEFHGKVKNVPITICGDNRTPIIEFLVSKEKTDEEILDYLKREIKKKTIVSFYIHDLYEARFKIDLLEKIFRIIKSKKIENRRVIDY